MDTVHTLTIISTMNIATPVIRVFDGDKPELAMQAVGEAIGRLCLGKPHEVIEPFQTVRGVCVGSAWLSDKMLMSLETSYVNRS